MEKKAVAANQKKVYDVRGGVAGLVLGLICVIGMTIVACFFIIKTRNSKLHEDYDEGGELDFYRKM